MMVKREYGIDLLRMLAMFMVCLLHVLRQSGALDIAQGTTESTVVWLLECAAYCAVNCYALISGYVGVNAGFKYRRIVKLWLQVTFYTLIISALFCVFSPELARPIDCVKALFPVLEREYWYFTAYFGLFFFMPYINRLLRSLDTRQLELLGATTVVLMSLLPALIQKDSFFVNGGYTFLWLMVLYILGGCARLADWKSRISVKAAVIGYVLCALITWADKAYLAGKCVRIAGYSFYEFGALTSYASPTVLFCAVFLLLAFAGMKLQKPISVKLISTLSPAAFGVYLIHTNRFVFTYTMRDIFGFVSALPAGKLLLCAIGGALAIYIVCTFIDLLRIKLFKLLKIPALVDRIADRFSKNTIKV